MSQREGFEYNAGSGSRFAGTDSTVIAELKVTYICGDCANKVSLEKEEKIRCSHCGHRVLYKERTKRMVQFEAR